MSVCFSKKALSAGKNGLQQQACKSVWTQQKQKGSSLKVFTIPTKISLESTSGQIAHHKIFIADKSTHKQKAEVDFPMTRTQRQLSGLQLIMMRSVSATQRGDNVTALKSFSAPHHNLVLVLSHFCILASWQPKCSLLRTDCSV